MPSAAAAVQKNRYFFCNFDMEKTRIQTIFAKKSKYWYNLPDGNKLRGVASCDIDWTYFNVYERGGIYYCLRKF